jgi:hypothetical protein
LLEAEPVRSAPTWVPGPPLLDALVAVFPVALCCANAVLDRPMISATMVIANFVFVIPILLVCYADFNTISMRELQQQLCFDK